MATYKSFFRETPSPTSFSPSAPLSLVQMSLLDFASFCTTLDLDLPLLGGEDWPLLLAHLLPGETKKG